MMNLKTTALLGNLTRQNVSKQLLPLSNTKNSVLTLSQRTAQPVSANTPTNPVRSFSSTQANRENNNPNHPQSPSSAFSHPLGTNGTNGRLASPLTANLTFHNKHQTNRSKNGNGTAPPGLQGSNASNKAIPKYNELSQSAWDAINGQDARAVFPFLQEMRHQGVYADSALSNRIVGQFLDMNNPQDAERALAMLVDCHRNHGRTLSPSHKNTYTALAKDIANHSSDFAQVLSLAKLLEKHGLLASAGFADGALRTYRKLKVSSGLNVLKSMVTSTDIETLLTLQASMTRVSNRYKQLIEILLDAKEMNIVPSQESCSRVSLSFMQLDDYSGQLAWDTAVQEIYPGFKPTLPEQAQEQLEGSVQAHISTGNNSSNTTHRRGGHQRHPSANINHAIHHGNKSDPKAQVYLRTGDPSDVISRACRAGYASVAVEEISKLLKRDQLPSPQAVADTIQVCAKRAKERTTDYQELYRIAQRSLDAIHDDVHRAAAQYEVYNAMLVANATIGDMASAKKNYDDIVQLGQFPDATGYATLLIATTTGAVDEANDALKILDEVRRHNIKPNIFFYNVVIGKLSRGRKIERVLEVYEDMVKQQIRPNAITYGTLISACTRVGSEEMAKNLFKEMTRGPNYRPRQGPHNAMIQFYVRQKKDRAAALQYYEDMLQRKLLPTEHTYTLLIEAFAGIQPYDMEEANRLVHSLKRGPVRATESHYAALIHSYGVLQRDPAWARNIFETMLRSGVTPKGPAYQSLIEGYIQVKDVNQALEIRGELLRTGQPSTTYIENTIIRGFGMIGDVEAAERVFQYMMDPSVAAAQAAAVAGGSAGSLTGLGSAMSLKGSKGYDTADGVVVKEPSTYQSMVMAYLENDLVDKAYGVLAKMQGQHYPELVVKPVEEAIQAAIAGKSAMDVAGGMQVSSA